MKKLPILCLALACLSFGACAQSPAIEKFYNKYKASGEMEANISMSPNFMISACLKGDGKPGDHNWLKKVKDVQLLILDEKKGPTEGEWRELSNSLRSDHFEDLYTIRKGRDRVQLMSAERRSGLKEVVFLAAGKEGGGIFLHFSGNFTAADLEQMQGAVKDKDEPK